MQPVVGAQVVREALRRCGGGILYAVAVGLFINLLYLIVPLYMAQVYDRVVPSRSWDTLVVLTVLAVAGLIFLGLLEFIRSQVFIVVGERLARRLGAPALEAAVRQSLRQPSASSRDARDAMRDVHELRQFITGGPVSLPFDAAISPLFLAVLFLLHPAYGAVGLVATVVLTLLSVVLEVLARRPQSQANDSALRSYGEVGTAIRHAELIESMGMLEALSRRWRRGQEQALRMVAAGTTTARAIAAIARSVRMALQIAMLATGATLLIDHEASAGSMMAAVIMMGRLLHPFEQLIQGWRQWCTAIACVSRLKRLLDGHVGDRSTVPAQAAAEAALVVERLGFVPQGSDRPVLKSLSFTVAPGTVLGVVGPSGAGKSTLVRLMVGLWRPSSGGIYLDGHDVYTWERTSFGRHVGYLPQNPVLLDGTVRENIARFTEADPEQVVVAAKAAGIHEMIGRLPRGYETVVGDGGFLLSGGQRQRIALARALFGAPRLLILDEPNASMDGEGEQALLRAIATVKAAGGTVVLVAQRLSVMAAADQLLVLREGQIEMIGSRAEIMKQLTVQGSGRKPSDRTVARLPATRPAVREVAG